MCISPPCNSVRLRAIESPKPLPSVFREVSPRTKRSISSSPEILSGYFDIFLKVITAFLSLTVKSIYTRVPGSEYLHTFPVRFSSTRHKCRPSAIILTGASGTVSTGVSPAFLSRSSNSPTVCESKTPASHSESSTFKLPLDAFEASTKSSISFLRRLDCLSSTSKYSFIFSFSGCSFLIKST